ncbi:hypothetical protein [Protaetiibacter mangrovi]|uniref:Uncharacterized protein n=1 Tax=Protaetiibacter mangrovi TaxID=2970926 RepID=A0ABT1ZIC0_9MICO|nr:hypothetical protein [Protaetiibacter mangrovi]MCS0500462.1 hypothetical protein [Protaetiibacter mangrovi]
MPTPSQIVAAQTALNRVELALQSLLSRAEDPASAADAGQALRDLGEARHNLS